MCTQITAPTKIDARVRSGPFCTSPWCGTCFLPYIVYICTRPSCFSITQIYGSDKYSQGFCLDVAAGETVALVGPSGGGKSTCMGLLLRFYEPAKGRVTIDGRDVKEVNVKWLRSQVMK